MQVKCQRRQMHLCGIRAEAKGGPELFHIDVIIIPFNQDTTQSHYLHIYIYIYIYCKALEQSGVVSISPTC